MLKKQKKLLFASSLVGLIVGATTIGVALSSCTSTNTSSTSNNDVQYSYTIDWNNEEQVKRLIIDDSGLVYADNSKTTIIAVSPKTMLNTITIPSTVSSIAGYTQITTNSKGVLVYQQVGAFQNMTSLETVILKSDSQLKSISNFAFSGCTALKTISGLSNKLNYIGSYAFNGCTNLTEIDTSNVVKIDNYAFSNCTNLSSVDLTNVIAIGNYAFQNCSNLTSLGSLEKLSSMGIYAFVNATKEGANISLKLSNLQKVDDRGFYGAKGISDVDFSNNTLLTIIYDNAFMYSSVTSVDLTGCSSLTTIDERAFEGCTNLTNVYLPSNDITSLTKIGYNAFVNCYNLTTVGVKGTAAKTFIATKKMNQFGANFLANTLIETVDLSNFVISSSSASTTPFGSAASLAYIPNLSSITLPSNIATLNAGLFYGSGLSSSTGFSLTLPSTVASFVYSASSVSIANPNSSSTINKVTIQNATPFTNSGLNSIDMSNITSYQKGSKTSIPSYLFKGATKLKSVILMPGTTKIEKYAFQDATALTSITYPTSSSTETVVEATNGFTADSNLATIEVGAFYNAFSEDSNATLNLSAMTFTNGATPAAFNNSNIANLVLPTTTTTITANSFDNMTKLTSVNFENLTGLTSIAAPNFNNTQLSSIDLSKTQFQTINGNGSLFTNLPTNSIVSLPNTIGNFSEVFKDTSGNYVTFKYPNGIKTADLLSIGNNGVMTFKSSINTNLLTNASELNLSSSTGIKSVGSNTFYESKLSSLTLPARDIYNANLFTTGSSSITANNSNTSDASAQYIKTNIPFGNNESLTSLNYTGFSTTVAKAEVNTYTTSDNSAQTTLFNSTNSDIWTKVAKIINSLSYQSVASNGSNVSSLKANMSNWAVESSGDSSGNAINTDATATFNNTTSGSEKVTLTNSFTPAANANSDANTASSNEFVINATDSSTKFIHNGITWTYTNDGSTIKLTGQANMYKATNSSNSSSSYLVFFNQTEYVKTSNTTTIYYVPSQTPVTVTLTIATATSNS